MRFENPVACPQAKNGMKSYIFCCIWALQSAAAVVVQSISASVHALEHIRQGWTGHGLAVHFLPLAATQALQLEIFPGDIVVALIHI